MDFTFDISRMGPLFCKRDVLHEPIPVCGRISESYRKTCHTRGDRLGDTQGMETKRYSTLRLIELHVIYFDSFPLISERCLITERSRAKGG